MQKPELAEYTIYLPLEYNDGTKIEEEKFNKTTEEIVEKFGALTRQKSGEGIWTSKEKTYYDSVDKIEIIIFDTEENDRWFKEYKGVLKKRFKQKEILIKKVTGMERL
ncbi:MAG: hypothetical protein AAB065_04815 [Deltaproteobacteria bacterium]